MILDFDGPAVESPLDGVARCSFKGTRPQNPAMARAERRTFEAAVLQEARCLPVDSSLTWDVFSDLVHGACLHVRQALGLMEAPYIAGVHDVLDDVLDGSIEGESSLKDLPSFRAELERQRVGVSARLRRIPFGAVAAFRPGTESVFEGIKGTCFVLVSEFCDELLPLTDRPQWDYLVQGDGAVYVQRRAHVLPDLKDWIADC